MHKCGLIEALLHRSFKNFYREFEILKSYSNTTIIPETL